MLKGGCYLRVIKSAIFILSLFLFVIVAVTPISAKQVIINTDKLNVRDGPGTEHKKIDQLHTGDIYQVIQTGIDWTEIQLEASSGWVKTEYITIKEDININEKTITIQHDNTQLQDEPSTEHDIIYFADKGAVLNIVDVHSDWYKVTSKDTTGFVLKELVTNKAGTISDGLKNKTIVIDAGHGGQDVGAIGVDGTFEKDITYKTAQELKQELSALGAEVILTRVKDEYISLGSRTSLANMPNTDAFISIHYNSAPVSPDVTGIGTYYLKEKNKVIAYFIQRKMIKDADVIDSVITIVDCQVIRRYYKRDVFIYIDYN